MKANLKLVRSVAHHTLEAARQNSPTILTGMAVAGLVGTVIFTGRGTIQAVRILDEEKARREVLQVVDGPVDYSDCVENPKDPDISIEPSAFETLKLTWRCYVPAALMGTVTIACLIFAYKVNMRRNAVLAALYSGSTKALEEYKDKVKEIVGEKKAEKVQEELDQDALTKTPVDESWVIRTGLGDTLCFDQLSGRYFKSDIEKLRQAQNDFNQCILGDMCLSLNDLYGFMGLDSIWLGDDIGWNYEKMVDFHFSSRLASNGTPCLVISHSNEPSYNYRSF